MSSEFSDCSDQAQSVYTFLLKMTSGESVRTKTVMEGLASRMGLDLIELKGAVRELYRAKLLKYQADSQDLPVSGLITIVRPIVEESAHEQIWDLVLSKTDMGSGQQDALRALHAKLIDLSVGDMQVLADALAELASAAGSSAIADAGFNVSARQLMGASKVLANLPPKMLQGLGLPARLQISSPRYVICAGPPAPHATLLIENPRAFENAVRSGLSETVALVCTYGFGLSYLGQAWTSDVLHADRPVQIVRAGEPPALEQLLQAENVYLWADLDMAALNILRSLQSAIPQLRFSRIYEIMLVMVRVNEKSHPYAAIFEKDGQTPIASTAIHPLDHAGQLIASSCRNRAVDQEAVLEQDILELGRYGFEPSC